jgi:CheY-like chemotaxis protein
MVVGRNLYPHAFLTHQCHFFKFGVGKNINHFRKNKYDVVLMDVQMPVIDGFEATHIIRALEADRGLHIPIIALTAYAMKSDSQKCLDSGMDDYLPKPVILDQLLAVVQKWTGKQAYCRE